MTEVPELDEKGQAALEQLRKMAVSPEAAESKKCIEGEPMLYVEYDRALIPGHIYSREGIAEARISGSCEYHFDRWFEPGWVDVVTGEQGKTPAEDDEEVSDGSQ